MNLDITASVAVPRLRSAGLAITAIRFNQIKTRWKKRTAENTIVQGWIDGGKVGGMESLAALLGL